MTSESWRPASCWMLGKPGSCAFLYRHDHYWYVDVTHEGESLTGGPFVELDAAKRWGDVTLEVLRG